MAAGLSLGLAAVTAEQAMHPGVISLDPQARLTDVAAAMARHRVHCVIVDGLASDRRGDERLVWGVITDADLVRALESRVDVDAGTLAAGEIVTADADQALDEVVQLLAEHDCTHVVVVRDGRPAGVVSTLDVARVVAGR